MAQEHGVELAQLPYWCFEIKPDQTLTTFMDIPLEGDNLVWQQLPMLFYPNGAIYVTRRDIIADGYIYGDRKCGYMMPRERSIDLEEEHGSKRIFSEK